MSPDDPGKGRRSSLQRLTVTNIENAGEPSFKRSHAVIRALMIFPRYPAPDVLIPGHRRPVLKQHSACLEKRFA